MNIIDSLKIGGAFIYPLLFLCLVASALIVDKFLLYKKALALPNNLLDLVKNDNLDLGDLESSLLKISNKNYYRIFFEIILKNQKNPIWLIESRAESGAKFIEKQINKGLWALDSIITAAPLLGLLGTIFGMMKSFKIIGQDGIVNPIGVTSGVAESLIATAIGLAIAVVALFAFNYFSKKNEQILQDLEDFGTKIVDKIKISNK